MRLRAILACAAVGSGALVGVTSAHADENTPVLFFPTSVKLGSTFHYSPWCGANSNGKAYVTTRPTAPLDTPYRIPNYANVPYDDDFFNVPKDAKPGPYTVVMWCGSHDPGTGKPDAQASFKIVAKLPAPVEHPVTVSASKVEAGDSVKISIKGVSYGAARSLDDIFVEDIILDPSGTAKIKKGTPPGTYKINVLSQDGETVTFPLTIVKPGGDTDGGDQTGTTTRPKHKKKKQKSKHEAKKPLGGPETGFGGAATKFVP